MKKTRNVIALGIGTALVVSGCGLEPTFDRWGPDQSDGFGYEYELSDVSVSQAALTGSLDDVAVDQSATSIDAWKDWYSVHIDVYAETAEGPTVMNQIELSGDLSDLRPGYSATSYPDDWQQEGARFDIIGCSGESIYNWNYDDMAQSVEYEVVEGNNAGEVTINYTARFYNWNTQINDEVSGTFNVGTGALER